MSRNKPPLKVVTLRLYEGDVETIQRYFAKYGYNVIIREKVHQLANTLRERERQVLNEGMQDYGDTELELDAGDLASDDGEHIST